MRNYELNNKWQKLLVPEIVALMNQIHEKKGGHTHLVESGRETLTQLMEIAKIQSTEASNKIEGIYTSNDRLKKLLQDKTAPRTRSEQEIAGYRDVLATIHASYEYIPLKPNMILQLHRDLYKFSGMSIGGSYKNSDNIIAETDESGSRSVRFVPVEAWATPEAVEQLCRAYNEGLQQGIDPLLLIPIFVLDFLCIHPFNDGNGRMSRLLTLLLLYRADYHVGKYISIEKLIEQSKETYYETLQASSIGWHEEKNNYEPFVIYLLGVILAAYRDFEQWVQRVGQPGTTKPDRVRDVIKNTLGKITKAEIMEQCPDISQVTIQRTLNELVRSGTVLKVSGGRYTAYTWNREEL